jgi:hypothetical protein
MFTTEQQATFNAATARFPAVFALRGHPDTLVRISKSSSYFRGPMLSASESDLVIYLEALRADGWTDFVKGSCDELMREMTRLPLPPGFALAGGETIGAFIKVCVDANALDCGARKLPYPTTIGLIDTRNWKVSVWTPAASKPRGYVAAARAVLEETRDMLRKRSGL